MKKWQKYFYIQIPIALLILIRSFIPENNKSPQESYHFLTEFTKTEYSVRDMANGQLLGNLFIEDKLHITFFGEKANGVLKIASYSDVYNYDTYSFDDLIFEKKIIKNLEFYTAKLGDWYTVIIFNLDKKDGYEFYKSEASERYIFIILENGEYNFSVNDDSVYDLYAGFCAPMFDSKYAALLE